MDGLGRRAELKVALECADVLFHGVQPVEVPKRPREVAEGAALQQLKADLIKEGRNAPGKSIPGMVEHQEGSSHSSCHTEQPVTSHTWGDAGRVSDLQIWTDRTLSCAAPKCL